MLTVALGEWQWGAGRKTGTTGDEEAVQWGGGASEFMLRAATDEGEAAASSPIRSGSGEGGGEWGVGGGLGFGGVGDMGAVGAGLVAWWAEAVRPSWATAQWGAPFPFFLLAFFSFYLFSFLFYIILKYLGIF